MWIALIWFIFSLAIGFAASSRGRGSGNWFVVAIVLSPLIAAILLFLSSDLSKIAAAKALLDAQPSDNTHVKCPNCAEFVLPAAKVCKHCGHDLIPDPGFTLRKAHDQKQAETEDNNNALLGWGIIAGIIVILWLLSR